MVSVSVLALFMAITIIAETVLFDFFISYLGIRPIKNFGGGVYYTSDYKDKDDAFEKANELNERINEEGIVLLKNENKNTSKPGRKGLIWLTFPHWCLPREEIETGTHTGQEPGGRS